MLNLRLKEVETEDKEGLLLRRLFLCLLRKKIEISVDLLSVCLLLKNGY